MKLIAGSAFIAFALYLLWWQYVVFGKRRDTGYGELSSLPVIRKFNAPLARLIWRLHGKPQNFAITLPHFFKRAAVISYARHFCTKPHDRHECGGHVPEIERLGPVDYTATYLWHMIALRRPCGITPVTEPIPPNLHEIEREACERERHLDLRQFVALGTPS